MTSEFTYRIDDQPSDGCPIADRGLEQIKATNARIDDAENQMADTRSEVDAMADIIEELRDKCSELRSWGQQWKDKALEYYAQLEDYSNDSSA